MRMKDTLHVWSLALRGPAASALAALPPAEQQRAARFLADEPRARFALCRSALRRILAAELGAAAHELVFEEGPHGKPRVGGAHAGALHFNVSHSAERALIAVCRAAPVGVDIERMRPLDKLAGLAEHTLSPRELERWLALPEERRQREFYRHWTLKEAILKACGAGITQALKEIELEFAPWEEAPGASDFAAQRTIADGASDRLERTCAALRAPLEAPELLREPNSGAALRWTLHEFSIDSDYAAALATQGAALRVIWHGDAG
jgi:4'-phosphopantetheinyl transferase